jgi:indole-3-acetate monooxygenase
MHTEPTVAAAAAFHDEIRTRADEIERARRIPADLAMRMASAGLFRLLVPGEYGGLEAHPQAFFDSLVTTSRADGAVGWCQMIGATTGVLAASLPDHWAQPSTAPIPTASRPASPRPSGRAAAVRAAIGSPGRWPFGSGSQVSDWICGGCVVMEDGAARNAHGAPGNDPGPVPGAEVTIHDTWRTSGLCGTGSHDIEVTDAFVPEGRWTVLGGRARVDAPLYRFPTLGLLALGVSAVAIGIARTPSRAFIDLARQGADRQQPHPRERAGVQKDLARAGGAGSARAFTHQAIDGPGTGARRGSLDVDRKAELRLAATNNAWAAAEAVDLVYHAAGGSSIYEHERPAALLPRRARHHPAPHGRAADLRGGGQGHARHRSEDVAVNA